MWKSDQYDSWNYCDNVKELEWQAHFLYNVKLEKRIASFIYALKNSLKNERLVKLVNSFIDNNYVLSNDSPGGINKKHKMDSYVLKVLKIIDSIVKDIKYLGVSGVGGGDFLLTEYLEDVIEEMPKTIQDSDFILLHYEEALLSSMSKRNKKILHSDNRMSLSLIEVPYIK